MRIVLVLFAALLVAGCNETDRIVNVCSEADYRCDSSTPSRLQSCVANAWVDNPTCDLYCGSANPGEVLVTNDFTCTCLDGGDGRCDTTD